MRTVTTLVLFNVAAALGACGDVRNTPSDGSIPSIDGTATVDSNGCGDHVIQPPEECDDGNTTDGDGCSATCHRDPPGSLTFYLAGRLTSLLDPGNIFGGQFGVGSQFSGRYTYNPTTIDSNTATDVGDYNHTTTGYGITVNLQGWTFRTNPTTVNFLYEVVNRTTGGAMVMHSYNNVSAPSVTGIDHISWQLDASSGSTPFPSDAILTQCPNVLAFTQPFGLTITGNIGGDNWLIRGTVESCMP
jgi:cysteine-rich repeat protein